MSSNRNRLPNATMALVCTVLIKGVLAAEIPARVIERLNLGEPVQLIVEYDDSSVEQDARRMRRHQGKRFDANAVLEFKAGRYKVLKDLVEAASAGPDIESLADYSHLPMSFKRFYSQSALNRFLARVEVKAVYEDIQLHPVLTESLPLINQPVVAAAGLKGNGTMVAVIDSGIDYTLPAFGSCTAPGVPSGCRVPVSLEFGSGSSDTAHGTNVSAIALGIAPDSRIGMLDVFSGTGAYTSSIVSAINWTISNQAAYNIAAINMSLGDSSQNSTQCSSGNPFLTPVANAKNAGISVVVAAGNGAFSNGLSMPACTPGVISVGAVYDTNVGGVNWGVCTDAATAADQITCFSNSAAYLTMLAPGAMITAAGITESGTSQAAPHVAGAIAVLRSAFPTETLAQTQARMTDTGVPIGDLRNGIVKPRLNLLEAARPGNNMFVNRSLLSANSGSASGSNVLATKESGEPSLAADPGGHSVWWKWVAPAAGQLTLDTHGSGFDTLLAVYSGGAVMALTQLTANDNDPNMADGTSLLLLQAQAGQEYAFVVDGAVNAMGSITLDWNLNTAAKANLSIGISGPASGSDGGTYAYTLSASNLGPQSATHVLVTLTLPAGASYVSGPSNCSINGSVVTCDLGTLASGTGSAPVIQITWTTASGSIALAAGITSDLTDPNNSNNSSSMMVAVSAGSGDTDAPTLPEWGMLLLAGLLLFAALRPSVRDWCQ